MKKLALTALILSLSPLVASAGEVCRRDVVLRHGSRSAIYSPYRYDSYRYENYRYDNNRYDSYRYDNYRYDNFAPVRSEVYVPVVRPVYRVPRPVVVFEPVVRFGHARHLYRRHHVRIW